jgi:hypothetical protein
VKLTDIRIHLYWSSNFIPYFLPHQTLFFCTENALKITLHHNTKKLKLVNPQKWLAEYGASCEGAYTVHLVRGHIQYIFHN